MPRIDRTGLNADDIRRAFLLDSKNRSLVMDEHQPRSIDTLMIFRWLVMSGAVIVGVLLLTMTLRAVQQFSTLTLAPVKTWGDIIDRDIVIGADELTYLVTVAYTVADTRYEREISVSQEIYERAENGEPILLFYALPEPQVVATELPTPLPIVTIGILTLVWNVPLVVLLLVWARSRRRRKRPLRQGKLIKAETVRSWASLRKDNIYLLNIEYRFVSPTSGAIIVDEASRPREDLRVSLEARPLHTATVLPNHPPLIVIYQNDQRYDLL